MRRADGDQFYNLFTKLTFHNVTLMVWYLGREKVVPTAHYGTVFPTDRTIDYDEYGYVDLKYEQEIAKGWKLVAPYDHDRYYYRGNYLYNYWVTADPLLVLNQDYDFGERWGGEVRLTKQMWQKHRVTLGAEYRDDFRREFNNADQDPFFSYLKTNKGSRNWALFLQDEFAILGEPDSQWEQYAEPRNQTYKAVGLSCGGLDGIDMVIRCVPYCWIDGGVD